MNVEELIEELKKQDQNALVICQGTLKPGWAVVEHVTRCEPAVKFPDGKVAKLVLLNESRSINCPIRVDKKYD
jgi:hypothetical protein